MEISTAFALALALFVVLFVPYAIFYIRRGKAHGHTWFTRWKPAVTPILAPMSDFDRLDRGPTTLEDRGTDPHLAA
jgi:hypothetical protein